MSGRPPSLVKRLMQVTVCINCLLLIALGFVVTEISRGSLHKEGMKAATSLLSQAGELMESYLENAAGRIISLSRQPSVIRCLSMSNPSFKETLVYERQFDQLLKNEGLFAPVADILIVGRNGYIYNLNGRMDLDSSCDISSADWMLPAFSSRKGVLYHRLPLHDQIYYSQISKSHLRSRPTLSTSMAVLNDDREVVGAIVYCFDLYALSQRLQAIIGESGSDFCLTDADGVIYLHNSFELIGTALGVTEADLLRMNQEHTCALQVDMKPMMACSRSLSLCDLQAVCLIPTDVLYASSRKTAYICIGAVLLCLCLNLLFSILYTRSVRKPVDRLIASISQIDMQKLRKVPIRTEFVQLQRISIQFNELLQQIDTLIQKEYNAQLQLSRAQLSSLKAQINPHFLFNTLQLLQTQILYGNTQRADQIIVTLSQLLRYSMNSRSSMVSLKDEFDYLKRYLLLFTDKYEGRLTTSFSLPVELQNQQVPHLLLQPVSENSIKYAAQATSDPCRIEISAQTEGDMLLIRVSNNGPGISKERLDLIRSKLDAPIETGQGGVGLANVHQRIRTIYGDAYGLAIDSYAGGTIVLLTLPYTRERE